MSAKIRGTCWHCATGLTDADYGREADCPGCRKATRVCRNCRHYAPGRANDCIEPRAESVLHKDRANFCEFFEPAPHPVGNSAQGASQASPETLLEAAQNLFE